MARYVEYQKEMAYRYYLTDAVNYINQGKYLGRRFAEIDKVGKNAQPEKTGDEIAADIISRLGLVVE